MHKVVPGPAWPLHGVEATRRIERSAAAALPEHALMQRAGRATARLALALAPHARSVWIACGPGNNGGDGLEAAVHLRQWGKAVHLTLEADAAALPPDAARSLARARAAGLAPSAGPPDRCDLAIDALLGLGARPLEGALAARAAQLQATGAPVLAIDVPSGLSADTGQGACVRADATLSLLTLKPGLWTGAGRDAAGQAWFDDLGVAHAEPATAWLSADPGATRRLHASHKGTQGDVVVLGGAPGMLGAAVLAATAALRSGAGRVHLAPLQDGPGFVPAWPELMLRDAATVPLAHAAVACGCGGGGAVVALLPRVLHLSAQLVLDADALNAVAADSALQDLLRRRGLAGRPTVLTPHPLEAARLLGSTTAAVQADRLAAAQALADRYACTVALKGSGTVVAAPQTVPRVNPTGNGRLATGGTGDVLAGMVAAGLARGLDGFEAATAAVYRHGALADGWPEGHPLTAGALAGG